jgi:hypothetical protein
VPSAPDATSAAFDCVLRLTSMKVTCCAPFNAGDGFAMNGRNCVTGAPRWASAQSCGEMYVTAVCGFCPQP